MIPLSYTFRKRPGGNKLTKSKDKINHFIYMDSIKLLAKNEKEQETLIKIIIIIHSQDIEMEFSIEKCAILIKHC